MKNILLAVTGASPQVLTETIYALHGAHKPLPSEIYVITTAKGKAQLIAELVDNNILAKLCNEYDLPQVTFTAKHIWSIASDEHQVVEGKTALDQQIMADFITAKVYQLCSQKNLAIHASIAGGRKTMAFYLGYAMSLFGRTQDTLSHVFVNDDFEFIPDFYYPTKNNHWVTRPRDNKRLDASLAQVTLVDIPFVRMRDSIPSHLTDSLANQSFNQTVKLINQSYQRVFIKFDAKNRCIVVNDISIKLSPKHFAFYLWLHQRQLQNSPPIRFDRYFEQDISLSHEFLAVFVSVSTDARVFKTFAVEPEDFREGKESEGKVSELKGMEKSFFEQNKAMIHRKFNEVLPKALAQKLYVSSNKVDGIYCYWLELSKEQMTVEITSL